MATNAHWCTVYPVCHVGDGCRVENMAWDHRETIRTKIARLRQAVGLYARDIPSSGLVGLGRVYPGSLFSPGSHKMPAID